MPQHFTRAPVARHRLSALTSAALALLALASTSRAMEIDTGNPDVVLRWDNTVRYNLGYRTQDQSKAILGNPNNDDGDRNFGNGAQIANRLDLLSEFDMVVDKKYGFRVSGDAWADGAYNSLDNHNNATANTLSYGLPTAGILSPYTSRYAKGPSGELLDAFVFGSRDFGDTNVGLRLGKTTVYWGESLLGGGAIHGISYGQYSLDLWKALATPGIEAKELYRPRTQMTLQVQPAPDLALSAQTFFDWESARYPESGSYLTVNDAVHRVAHRTGRAAVSQLRGSDLAERRIRQAGGKHLHRRALQRHVVAVAQFGAEAQAHDVLRQAQAVDVDVLAVEGLVLAEVAGADLRQRGGRRVDVAGGRADGGRAGTGAGGCWHGGHCRRQRELRLDVRGAAAVEAGGAVEPVGAPARRQAEGAGLVGRARGRLQQPLARARDQRLA